MRILVTGATGNVGGVLVELLADAGIAVRALTRDGRRVRPRECVETHVGDLRKPDGLAPAMSDVDALFLVRLDDVDIEPVVQLAAENGVRRVVAVSSLVVQNHPESVIGRNSLAGELAIRNSGVRWTLLRPGQFMSNSLWWAESVRRFGAVQAPFADVAFPAIHPGDIAEVAKCALLSDGHAERVYPLTGPEPVSARQQVAAIAEVLGRDLGFEEISGERAAENMGRYLPAEHVTTVLDLMGRTAAPVDAAVLPAVRDITGNVPRAFHQWVRENADKFR